MDALHQAGAIRVILSKDEMKSLGKQRLPDGARDSSRQFRRNLKTIVQNQYGLVECGFQKGFVITPTVSECKSFVRDVPANSRARDIVRLWFADEHAEEHVDFLWPFLVEEGIVEDVPKSVVVEMYRNVIDSLREEGRHTLSSYTSFPSSFSDDDVEASAYQLYKKLGSVTNPEYKNAYLFNVYTPSQSDPVNGSLEDDPISGSTWEEYPYWEN